MTASLLELYLLPLRRERDGGHVLRETLRAYFAADRNGSSAAAALGVSRQTVANRLQAVERQLNQSLKVCADLLHVALRLEELGLVDLDDC
jgi:DNA-binding PucR family transcriptional regulator